MIQFTLNSGLVRESESPLVCEFCGCEIEVVGQFCPALDDGRCRP